MAEGSATVALTMAEHLGHRIRFNTTANTVEIGSAGYRVITEPGERFESDAIVCALPAGSLRRLRMSGV